MLHILNLEFPTTCSSNPLNRTNPPSKVGFFDPCPRTFSKPAGATNPLDAPPIRPGPSHRSQAEANQARLSKARKAQNYPWIGDLEKVGKGGMRCMRLDCNAYYRSYPRPILKVKGVHASFSILHNKTTYGYQVRPLLVWNK